METKQFQTSKTSEDLAALLIDATGGIMDPTPTPVTPICVTLGTCPTVEPTATSTPLPTETSQPTATLIPAPKKAATVALTNTVEPNPTATETPTSPTWTPSLTPFHTSTPSVTPTPTETNTPIPTATPTPTETVAVAGTGGGALFDSSPTPTATPTRESRIYNASYGGSDKDSEAAVYELLENMNPDTYHSLIENIIEGDQALIDRLGITFDDSGNLTDVSKEIIEGLKFEIHPSSDVSFNEVLSFYDEDGDRVFTTVLVENESGGLQPIESLARLLDSESMLDDINEVFKNQNIDLLTIDEAVERNVQGLSIGNTTEGSVPSWMIYVGFASVLSLISVGIYYFTNGFRTPTHRIWDNFEKKIAQVMRYNNGRGSSDVKLMDKDQRAQAIDVGYNRVKTDENQKV